MLNGLESVTSTNLPDLTDSVKNPLDMVRGVEAMTQGAGMHPGLMLLGN